MTTLLRLSQDIRFGLRYLCKHPNYSLTVLVTLVLTIASVTTMFTLVSQVVIRPLPLPDAEQLVAVDVVDARSGAAGRSESVPFATFEEWQAASAAELELAWAVIESSVLTETDIGVYSAGYFVSYNFLSMIGVEPLLGRWFTLADAGQPVLAISYDMWQRDLGGDPRIVGRTIALDRNPYTVIAVMPQDYLASLEPRVRYWRPVDSYPRGGAVLGRLAGGLTPGNIAARSEPLNRVLQRGSAQHVVRLAPLLDRLLGSTRSELWLLLAGVAALFLVATLNLTNLTFAYLHNRLHELTTRGALGATRARLVRQLVIENLALFATAAVASIAVAAWLLEIALAIMPDSFPRKADIELDATVWLFALLASLATGIAVTMIPALRIADPARLIQFIGHGGTRLAGSFGNVRLRRGLITAQVGLALTLLVAVGLLTRSYQSLLSQDIGFTPEHVVSGHIWRPEGFSDAEISRAFDTVLDEIAAVPDVSMVAAGSTIPMGPIATRVDPSIGFSYTGQPPLGDGEEARVAMRTVTDAYFRVLGVPLVSGRFFDGRERTSDNPTLIVNRAMAETLWPDGNAVGRELTIERASGDTAHTIVGVVENYRFEGLAADIKPEIFMSMSQQVFGGASYIARIRSDNAAETMQTITRIASQLDSSMPMIEVHLMSDLVQASAAVRQAVLGILVAFGAFATLLAGVGIYGLTSYLIGSRVQEIAVRVALGADRRRIRSWVIVDALIPAATGVVGGLLLTIPLARALGSFLFGIDAWDLPAYAGALAVVLLVAALAPVGPAIRAARAQPNDALRSA